MNTSQSEPGLDRPKEVSHAARLIAASLLLGLARIVFDHEKVFGRSPIWFVLPVMLISIGLVIGLSYLWYRGKNWARITFGILFGLGIVVSLIQFDQQIRTFQRSIIIGSISAAQSLLQLAAIVLLFLPNADAWFRKER